MKKFTISASLSLFFSLPLVALDYETSCRFKLSNGAADSGSRRVWADFSAHSRAEDNAVILIRRVLTKVGCENMKLELGPVTCKTIVPQKQHSQVCFVESQIGYFFVAQDFVDSANVIFNRWD
jgi:hypothetical protein